MMRKNLIECFVVAQRIHSLIDFMDIVLAPRNKDN